MECIPESQCCFHVRITTLAVHTGMVSLMQDWHFGGFLRLVAGVGWGREGISIAGGGGIEYFSQL
jgi:hypothetical protein